MLKRLWVLIFGGCYHDWTKWEMTETFNIKRISTESIIGKGIIQKRHCNKCGLSELKSNNYL